MKGERQIFVAIAVLVGWLPVIAIWLKPACLDR
jgi:hypothetical protein